MQTFWSFLSSFFSQALYSEKSFFFGDAELISIYFSAISLPVFTLLFFQNIDFQLWLKYLLKINPVILFLSKCYILEIIQCMS